MTSRDLVERAANRALLVLAVGLAITGGMSAWIGSTRRAWQRILDLEAVMGKLIYAAIASADGYIEDPEGGFAWGAPDEELLSFINELERPARTHLYGRRMYEVMLYWETAHTIPDLPPLSQAFTDIWRAAEKIVFSTTLASPSSAKTRIEPTFEPGIVRKLKLADEHEMTVGGADLAGQAIEAGLVDELRLFVVPVALGGGKRALPDGVRSDLELLDTQRFTSGAVYLRYRPQSA